MGIRALQHKCDSQVSVVEAFGGLLTKGDAKEKAMLKKIVVIEETWFTTIEKINKCK